MAGISGLSGTTSSSLNSLRGYGGLSSGLDRDTLIENLTYGTTSKITQQRLKKTTLQWKQDAFRNISSKMISFAEKYTSTFTSSTNLFSSSFWGRSSISAHGANSKYVSVSGTALSESSFAVAGIKQLAQKAKWSSDAGISDSTLKSGTIDPSKPIESEILQGKTLEVEFGGKRYSVALSGKFSEDAKDGSYKKGDAYKFDTQENIAAALNDLFSKEKLSVTTDKAKTLGDVMKVAVEGDKLVIKANAGKEGNALKLKGGTALETLGFSVEKEGTEITDSGIEASKKLEKNDLIKETSFIDSIAGKKLTFNYNGVYKDIELPGVDKFAGKDNDEIMNSIKESMQNQLDSAFGKGRVTVETVGDDTSGYQLSFKASLPGGGDDKSSTLTVVSGDSELMGSNGALKMAYGESNRINLDAKLSEAGFSGLKDVTFPAKIKINDAEIEVTKDDTMYTLMNKINSNEKAGVTISYESTSDRITMTANAEGASGVIKFGGDDKLLKGIFGQNVDVTKEIRGQDAIVAVKYGNSDEAMEIVRGSNNFTIDGINVGLKETFGYKTGDDGKTLVRDEKTEDITFQAKPDTEKIVNTIKDMVKEYNEILELVNKEVSTRPNRDYQPLTSEQKKELSEDDIKLYEEKAKEGLLFGDSDLRSLSNSLRFIINPTDLAEMEKIGITVSSEYSENGKLSIDETKLKAALESNPDNVKNLFTKKAGESVNGVVSSSNGIAENLKNVFDTYVRTTGATKGALIEKAGSVKAPTSVLTNALYKQMSEIDKTIARLETRLKSEQDRYIKQFTSLESLISQMNNQSSWLSQFGGSY